MSRETELSRNQGTSLVQSDRRPSFTPACDVYENADEILLVADVPGVKAENIEVHLDKGELAITAHRDVAPERQGSYLDVEYRTCDFHRQFAVPGGIDAGKISAEVKDGVLQLHLPKSEVLKPREIPVRSA